MEKAPCVADAEGTRLEKEEEGRGASAEAEGSVAGGESSREAAKRNLPKEPVRAGFEEGDRERRLPGRELGGGTSEAACAVEGTRGEKL